MAAFLVGFLLFYLYLVVIPIGISPFETPKVILAEILIDILLLVTILRINKLKIKQLIDSQLIFIGILFLLSLDTQLLFQPPQAFFGNIFRLQGQFLFWHLLIFSLLSKHIQLNKLPSFIFYLSFLCLPLVTLILGVNQNNRAFGSLGEPNALASTALFLFPFIWFKSPSKFKLFPLILTLIVIVLSGSRAGLIGLGIEVLFILALVRISIFKAVLTSLILILLTLFLPFIDYQGWFENRAEIWHTSYTAGLQSPVIGHGFGNIQNIIHQTATKLDNNTKLQVVDSSHNFLLDYWIQGGLVGLVCILMLIGLSIQGLIRSRKTLELTAFLGVITAMLFNPVSVVTLVAFWWLIGRGSSLNSREGFQPD